MKILIGSDVTFRGGVDGYVVDLIRALRQAGHAPVLAVEETTTSALRHAHRMLPGLEIHVAPLYHGKHPHEDLRRAASALLADVGPQGVHIACGSPRSCMVLREAAVKCSIPLIVTEQQIRTDLTLAAEDARRVHNSYRNAHQVVFVSEGNRSTMSTLLDLTDVSHCVIPNGVDVVALSAKAGPSQRRSRVPAAVMTAARFAAQKGLDVLIRAVARLPDTVVRSLDLFGEGPEWHTLQRLIDDLDENHRVTLRPWRQDVPEQLGQHDLFVLPSLDEGMPYALLEAMAVGIPVIATDIPGNAEALAHGAAGTLVPRRDVAALARAVTLRLADPAGSEQLAAHARRRVADVYDLADQMRRTVSLWAPIN